MSSVFGSIAEYASWLWLAMTKSDSGTFSASSLTKVCLPYRLDSTIYENALQVLQLPSDLTPEQLETQHRLLVSDLRRKISRASPPIAPILQALLADVDTAYQTIQKEIGGHRNSEMDNLD